MADENPFDHYEQYNKSKKDENLTQTRLKQPLYRPQLQPHYVMHQQSQPQQPKLLELINKVGSLIFHLAKDFKKFQEVHTEKVAKLQHSVDLYIENSQKNYNLQTVLAVSVLGKGFNEKNLEITTQYNEIKKSVEDIKKKINLDVTKS